MKIFAFGLLALSATAQDSSLSVASRVDINGRRVTENSQTASTKSATGSETTERTRSINGRTVPLERVEEKVLRDDASGRVVERITKRYDPNGNLSETVKQNINLEKRSDGSSTMQTSTYRSDLNGGMRLNEKVVTETHKSGSTETSETVVQRPTLNGSFDTVEKQSKVVVDQPNGFQESTEILRRDGNGGLAVAVKKTTEHTKQGGQDSDNTAEWEIGSDGRLQLHGQTVTKTITRADGSKESVVDVFGINVPGTVNTSGNLKLQEQQLIQNNPSGGGATTETISVRRPTVSDPNTLGPARQISEITCKGKCTP